MSNYYFAPFVRGHQDQSGDQIMESPLTPNYSSSGSESSYTLDHEYEPDSQEFSIIAQGQQDRAPRSPTPCYQSDAPYYQSSPYNPYNHPQSELSNYNNHTSGNFITSASGNKRKPVEGLSETYRRLKRTKLNEYTTKKTTKSRKPTDPHEDYYMAPPYSPRLNPHQLDATSSEELYPRQQQQQQQQQWDNINIPPPPPPPTTSQFKTYFPEREIEPSSSMTYNLNRYSNSSSNTSKSYSPPPAITPPRLSMEQEQYSENQIHPSKTSFSSSSSSSSTQKVLDWFARDDDSSFDNQGGRGGRGGRGGGFTGLRQNGIDNHPVNPVSERDIIDFFDFKGEEKDTDTDRWYKEIEGSEEKEEEEFDGKTCISPPPPAPIPIPTPAPTPPTTESNSNSKSRNKLHLLPNQGAVYTFTAIPLTPTPTPTLTPTSTSTSGSRKPQPQPQLQPQTPSSRRHPNNPNIINNNKNKNNNNNHRFKNNDIYSSKTKPTISTISTTNTPSNTPSTPVLNVKIFKVDTVDNDDDDDDDDVSEYGLLDYSYDEYNNYDDFGYESEDESESGEGFVKYKVVSGLRYKW